MASSTTASVMDKVSLFAKAGLPVGLLAGLVNFLRMRSGAEAVDISEILTFVLGPAFGGLFVSSLSNPAAAWRDRINKRLEDFRGKLPIPPPDGDSVLPPFDGGNSTPLLQLLRLLFDRFGGKGLPDNFETKFVYNNKVYRLQWSCVVVEDSTTPPK